MNSKPGEYYLLYTDCIAVKGAARSSIVDLLREDLYFISNELYDLILELRNAPLDTLKMDYDELSWPMFDAYIGFLQENDLGFWTTDPQRFPPMSLQWDHPSLITNAIIDVKKESDHDLEDIFQQLEHLGCRDIQFRYYDTTPIAEIATIMNLLETSRIKSVEFIFKYSKACTKKALYHLTQKYFRIKTITIHGSPKDETYVMRRASDRCGMGNIMYLKQDIDSNRHCGQISERYFSISGVKAFTEAINYNSCLNRKIAIDYDGSIKNCPTLEKSYGNVKQQKLHAAINDEFKQWWYIKKDQIEVCQVCEFRYVCTDCRAFVKGALDKPLKCSYNPYTLSWG